MILTTRIVTAFYYGERHVNGRIAVNVQRHAINRGIDIPDLDAIFPRALKVYTVTFALNETTFKLYFALYEPNVPDDPPDKECVVFKCDATTGLLFSLYQSDYVYLEAVLAKFILAFPDDYRLPRTASTLVHGIKRTATVIAYWIQFDGSQNTSHLVDVHLNVHLIGGGIAIPLLDNHFHGSDAIELYITNSPHTTTTYQIYVSVSNETRVSTNYLVMRGIKDTNLITSMTIGDSVHIINFVQLVFDLMEGER